MPRPKKQKTIKEIKEPQVVKKIEANETIISMVLGILVLVAAGALIFKQFRSSLVKKELPHQQTEEAENKNEEELKAEQTRKYTVKKGDNLWKISMEFYGSGYNWVDISKANNLKDPGKIEEGQELIIPDVAPRKVVEKAKEGLSPIEGNEYQVVKGDNLWTISVRAYQDGYRWVEIARANKLANPDIIHPGNILVIPR